jgi:endonuclease/exonuclease/phosphatase family metal-dependent hydrolase
MADYVQGIRCTVIVCTILGACSPQLSTDTLEHDTTVTETTVSLIPVSIATLNLLHGLSCGMDFCRLEDRIELLGQWVEAQNCPDIVTLQEITDASADLLLPVLTHRCSFSYTLTRSQNTLGADDEVVLSRYPVIDSETLFLENGFRHLLRAQIEHPVGNVHVFATHLASGSDNGSAPCPDCPVACMPDGATTLRDCQAMEVATAVAKYKGLRLVTGDFNGTPSSFLHSAYTGLGWLDTTRVSGAPECVAATGTGCTSGRADDVLTELEATALGTNERVDYIWQVGGLSCAVDETQTGFFAHQPNPFAPLCGAAPLPICWPSDHNGVATTLQCSL